MGIGRIRKSLIFTSFALIWLSAAHAQVPHPFFLEGDGKLKIVNQHNGRVAEVQYRRADGTLDDVAFAKIDQVFGFNTVAQGENISRRMLAMLDYFSDQLAPGKSIRLVSGYRSQAYNNGLRKQGKTAARTSTHIDGMAIDFSLDGVNGNEMWDYIRAKNCCGAGNYHGNVVHLDSGKPRFWQTETSKVHTDASAYNRFIYLSSDYDRYRAGSRMRLFFTSISDFGFGVQKNVTLVAADHPENEKESVELTQAESCQMINTRHDARFMFVQLPSQLKRGRYRVRIDFCNKPFPLMPDQTLSNEIEILSE